MMHTKNMILVVDDDAFQRELIGMQLAHLGCHQVHLACDGEEALALFDTHGEKINVIITDLSMPGMDGLVLMRHLAQRGFQAPIILLSGVDDEILNSAAGLAQAHGLYVLGVLPKPTSRDRLGALLADLRPPPPRTSLPAWPRLYRRNACRRPWQRVSSPPGTNPRSTSTAISP